MDNQSLSWLRTYSLDEGEGYYQYDMDMNNHHRTKKNDKDNGLGRRTINKLRSATEIGRKHCISVPSQYACELLALSLDKFMQVNQKPIRKNKSRSEPGVAQIIHLPDDHL